MMNVMVTIAENSPCILAVLLLAYYHRGQMHKLERGIHTDFSALAERMARIEGLLPRPSPPQSAQSKHQ